MKNGSNWMLLERFSKYSWSRLVMWNSSSESVVYGAYTMTSSENLIKMKILGLNSRHIELEILGVGPH